MSTMEDWRWASVAPDRLADYPPHFTTEVLTLDIRWGGGGDDHYRRLELVYCCCIARQTDHQMDTIVSKHISQRKYQAQT